MQSKACRVNGREITRHAEMQMVNGRYMGVQVWFTVDGIKVPFANLGTAIKAAQAVRA